MHESPGGIEHREVLTAVGPRVGATEGIRVGVTVGDVVGRCGHRRIGKGTDQILVSGPTYFAALLRCKGCPGSILCPPGGAGPVQQCSCKSSILSLPFLGRYDLTYNAATDLDLCVSSTDSRWWAPWRGPG
jgi:hypothetical protein